MVFPNIWTKLGFCNALTTKSATTVESLPPEKDITVFSGGYLPAVSLMKSYASDLI